MTAGQHSLKLTRLDRQHLAKGKFTDAVRAKIPHLWPPYEAAYRTHVLKGRALKQPAHGLCESFRLCARMMLDLDCTYWAFTWDRLIAWRSQQEPSQAARTSGWRANWHTKWTEVTSTLFFLGVLSYREDIHRANHVKLAYKWLGAETARAIEAQFVAMAKAIGYRHERQVLRRGASVVLAVLTAKRTTDLASITKNDLEAWEAQTRRSRVVAGEGVTTAQKVLAAMGYLEGAPPRRAGGESRARASWGRTAADIVDTCERFLADLRATRRAGTVEIYELMLRRFGDWLGHHDPTVRSVADVRRPHIEAYKRAVAGMKSGDYTSALRPSHLGAKRGAPFSTAYRIRCISCVRTFFAIIDALEYPERPGRQLFIRGDVGRPDDTAPRFIPDPAWHGFLAAAMSLTPEMVTEHRLPLPYERTAAVLAVLLECGLRADELCRLDTGCVITAQDAATGQVTHWLRVPVGKLHNDRMVPVRPALVAALDTWMRRRGPQPLQRDERTDGMRDYLFAWQGASLRSDALNNLIARVCELAGVPRATSHQFRHTLAVQWRKNGMKIETISRMLGHKSLRMTMRYAAVMPETVRREFDAAFAAIDEEHRTTAQVRVLLSPEAHLAASQQWRESLWVDLGVGFCGLSAYLPCRNRLACLPCPHFIATEESLPVYGRQRANLVALRLLGENVLPIDRKQEIDEAVEALDHRIADVGGGPGSTTGLGST